MRSIQRHLVFPLFALASFLLFQFNAIADTKNQIYDNNAILATIDDHPITIQDIEDRELNQLRIEFYRLLRQRLLFATIEKLAATHPEYAQKPHISISDKKIADFYYDNKLQSRGTLKNLSPHIKVLLESQAKLAYYESLFEKAKAEGIVTSFLTEPEAVLLKVPVETAYLRGNQKASVMLLEFSDYQCPFCGRVQDTIDNLISRYKDTVLFAYRHSPLPFHREADEAAIAAECARDQGKFKQLHKILFDNYRNISIDRLTGYAKEAGVEDMSQFSQCLESEKYRPRLENDQKAAAEAGINGTPGFIIGYYDAEEGVVKGELLSGALPERQFIDTIDKYLKP